MEEVICTDALSTFHRHSRAQRGPNEATQSRLALRILCWSGIYRSPGSATGSPGRASVHPLALTRFRPRPGRAQRDAQASRRVLDDVVDLHVDA
jgi:hypothetical protein